MGQSEIVKVRKSFFLGHKIQQSGTVLKAPPSDRTGMRAGGPRDRVSPAPHTKLTPHLLSFTARSFFLRCREFYFPSPCHSAPYTLYFIHHFIHPSKEALLWYSIKKRAKGIFLFISTILFFSFAFFRVVRVWKPLHLALRRKCVSKTG